MWSLDTEKISFIRRQFIAIEPLESSFLIHKAMRFDSKGGRILDVISDNYEKLALRRHPAAGQP